ncbi:putative ABC transporter permease [Fontibacillus sp. BL9]|uniref:putative ABC transporter permease n=1 Tax=Fontibacillus sp. BL9 TaxID=3389971 RepID=UPI00397CB7B2
MERQGDTLVAESLFYFLLYSLFGWILENVYSFATTGVFWKEGFMKGPYKPMYGFAPLLLLLLLGESRNPLLIVLLCLAVPTAVEYVSGYLLQTLFGRQWWDYSNNRGQLHGHICLRFSLYWGILSIAFLRYIHPLMERVYAGLEPSWNIAGPALLLLFLADLAWTYKTRRRDWKQSPI